ncbi:hypothetical protein K2O51_06635 [Cupriavidus pinatubonensis]|uniref:TadG family pilus assembly protein n=1 Tax=Cupriavidus pinatubonensis TaxID=248026 RepID=UPI00112D00C5|nr:TadG family pilus assembly protein [Cupriavidus pinatubonensis]QYY27625.1 hypothetical protein K2O51_06635 [Cupriavidus pinatubonensis]TPQ37790.1 hypothetical protein C2U69_15555 [Cupriavidus pinatubonensis]
MTTGRDHTTARERGAVSTVAVILTATVAFVALLSIDVGHVFMRQRQLQNMVDLSALSGAQQLKLATSAALQSAGVLGTVQTIGSQNGYPSGIAMGCANAAAGSADAMTACLGVWDPVYNSGSDTARHFNAAYDATKLSPNAVRVQATQTVPILFVLPGGQSRQLHAEAIASGSPPVAAFSLGSGLASFSSANSLLGLLLGNSVNFSAVDWQGLVDANVTLDQLRLKLGVGTVSELLNTRLTLQQFDALVLGAAGKDALLSTALGSPPTQLGASGASASMTLGQLIDLGVLAPAASSAAEVGLNVANLLLAGAQLANGNSAVTVPVTGTLPAGLGGLSARLRIIQPPVMAVGPARKLSDSPVTWQTAAHTAQVGLALSASVNTGVVNLNVPLYVEAARADASLTSLQCAAGPADRRATLHVAPSLVKACLANAAGTGCASSAVNIGSVSVIGLGLLNVWAHDNPQQVAGAGTDVTMAPGGHVQVSSGDPVGGVLANAAALNLQATSLLGLPVAIDLSFLAPILALLGTALDSALVPLLGSLGLQLGTADLWLHNIDCNNAELVY